MAGKLRLKRIKNVDELEKLLPHDDSDGEFYLFEDKCLNRVFIKRLVGSYTDGDYYCNERYFINHNPSFEDSGFGAYIQKLPIGYRADVEFHEYKDYGDMEYELKSGEFELYSLKI